MYLYSAILRKIPTIGMEEGDLEYAISREDQEKNHMEFPGVLVFLGLKISERLTQFG